MAEEELRLRPDVRYQVDERGEPVDEPGFRCRDCDWTGDSLPVNLDDEELFDGECPECGCGDVENTLTTAIEEIYEVWGDVKSDGEFVAYSVLEERFSGSIGKLDKAVNYLLTHEDAYVVVEAGEPLLYLVPRGREEVEE